jgi:ricin-type beta-trefoil lectin protein
VRDPFNGMCVTAAGNGSADGTQVVAWQCDGDAAQQWTAYSREVPGQFPEEPVHDLCPAAVPP